MQRLRGRRARSAGRDGRRAPRSPCRCAYACRSCSSRWHVGWNATVRTPARSQCSRSAICCAIVPLGIRAVVGFRTSQNPALEPCYEVAVAVEVRQRPGVDRSGRLAHDLGRRNRPLRPEHALAAGEDATPVALVHAPMLPSTLARGPPSTSGPGRHPFKVVARVRIPLGAYRPDSQRGFGLDKRFMHVPNGVRFASLRAPVRARARFHTQTTATVVKVTTRNQRANVIGGVTSLFGPNPGKSPTSSAHAGTRGAAASIVSHDLLLTAATRDARASSAWASARDRVQAIRRRAAPDCPSVGRETGRPAASSGTWCAVTAGDPARDAPAGARRARREPVASSSSSAYRLRRAQDRSRTPGSRFRSASQTPARRPVGGGGGRTAPVRAPALGRPATAALHRPSSRRRARRDPDGRAVLLARPPRDGDDRELILELRSQLTVVIVTHNLAQARRVSDLLRSSSTAGSSRPARLSRSSPQPREQATAAYLDGAFG